MLSWVPLAVFVATYAARLANAALFAAAMLASGDAAIADALAKFRARQTDDVANNDDPRK